MKVLETNACPDPALGVSHRGTWDLLVSLKFLSKCQARSRGRSG